MGVTVSNSDSKRQDNHASESVHDAIARLRAKQTHSSITAQPSSTEAFKHHTKNVQKRATKHIQPASLSERQNRINTIIYALLMGELTQGFALKELRMEVLGIKQDVFAKMVGVSRKTISEIENDRGSFNTDILNKVFKPFGLKVGLIPVSTSHLSSVLTAHTSSCP
jgi:DNA-binding XRE family transcriptional regulator